MYLTYVFFKLRRKLCTCDYYFLSIMYPVPPPKYRNPKNDKELIVTLISVTICKFDIFFCTVYGACPQEAGSTPWYIVAHKIIPTSVNFYWPLIYSHSTFYEGYGSLYIKYVNFLYT